MNSSYDAVIRESSNRRISVFQFSKTYPAFITLILGLAISWLVWNFISNKVHSERVAEFDKATTSVSEHLELGFLQNKQVLTSMDGLYKNSVQVVRDMFELYGSIPTRTNPSIQSIYYAPYIPRDKKEQFVFYAQSERYYDYSIKPAGNRDYYLPIEFVVPPAQIAGRSGLDLAVTPEAYATIMQAREAKGEIVASPFYGVRKDTLGFIMCFKVENKPAESSILDLSRGSKEGYVILEVNAQKFFMFALGANEDSDNTIIYQVYDQNSDKSIYSSANVGLLETGYSPMFSEYHTVAMANRKLRVKFTTIPDFGGKFQSALPLLSFLATLALSFIAFGFVLSITTSRARALDLADRLTRSQRRIIEASKDIIAVLDISGNYKTLSPAAEQILGYAINELIGTNIADYFANANDRSNFKKKIDETSDESGASFDVQIVNKNNETRWLSWNLTISRADGNIYATGRDITLQKIAEDQIRLKNRQVELAERQTLEASEFKSRFMRELSHKIRNNLTGTLGFIQLLNEEMYQDENEEKSYLEQAEMSSEQLFSVVTDIIDVAGESDSKTQTKSSTACIPEAIQSMQKYFAENKTGGAIALRTEIETPDICVVGDLSEFANCLVGVCKALAPFEGAKQIKINARANVYEKVAEIEILAPYDENVARLINIYKQNSHNLIDALASDSNDVLFNIGLANSGLRRLNGTLTIDSLGQGAENIGLITVPLSKGKAARNKY